MGIAVRRRLWALGCALSLLFCVPLVRPWLQMGMIDDPSYTRSAQILAQTGHIVYNGWSTAMLGWHLYWGAAFIKLFGFSFNVTRMSTLPVAMATAFLAERTMVRAGLTDRNATLATLTLVLSPMFLPMTFSYMTDIGGLFVLLLCFYGCIRALQTSSDRSACLWLAFSAIANGMGGSIRQIAWLGLLVIIPSTLWLMRGRRRVLLWGCVSLLCGLGIMLGTMEWYKHQPLTNPEQLWRGPLTKDRLRSTVSNIARTLFDAPVFLLPVLLVFVPKVRWKDWRAVSAFVAGGLALWAILLLIQHQPAVWLEPSMGNTVSKYGVLSGTGINGLPPLILRPGVQAIFTALVIAGISAVFVVTIWSRGLPSRQTSQGLSRNSLFVLTVPFSAVYVGLMMSRASVGMVFDRYLLPLLFVVLLLLVRRYQERIAARLPAYAFAILGVVAIFGIGATHDAFARLRARLDAARELEARGVPDTEIDGGMEFNSWTVLKHSGVLVPVESYQESIPTADDPDLVCPQAFPENIPGLHPKYALSFDPNGCGGQVGIPPVHYREWFGPGMVNIYIVSPRKQPADAAAQQH